MDFHLILGSKLTNLDWYKSNAGFQASVGKLKPLFDQAAVSNEAHSRYSGARGAMVVDVVTSRQRQYETRVLGIVRKWSATVPESSLQELSKNPLDKKTYGLRDGESETIQAVAKGFLRFGEDQNITDEDEICFAWATAVEELRFTPKLDPYIGSIEGMGIALFSYARKLSGADAIKPDVRVRQRLKSLGIDVPDGSQALMMLCELLAEELGVTRSHFDTVLWKEPA